MIQVCLIDENGFYTGESKFVDEVTEGMTTVPYLVGHIKGKLVNGEWTEGATEEEIAEWKISQEQTKICFNEPKTNEQLTIENKQLWETVEFLLKQVDLIPREGDAIET